jgi:hypothetical protein
MIPPPAENGSTLRDLRAAALDLWVFYRGTDVVRYLLLQTSRQKADRWFDGGRFRMRIRIAGLLGQVRSPPNQHNSITIASAQHG